MPHADPAARQAYNRDYKRANRDRYRRRQKSYDAAKHANERAAAFGVEGTLTPEDVEQVLSVGACHWAPLTATEPPCVMGDRYQLLPSDNGRAVYVERVGKKAAGRLLDGRTWDEIPGPVR